MESLLIQNGMKISVFRGNSVPVYGSEGVSLFGAAAARASAASSFASTTAESPNSSIASCAAARASENEPPNRNVFHHAQTAARCAFRAFARTDSSCSANTSLSFSASARCASSTPRNAAQTAESEPPNRTNPHASFAALRLARTSSRNAFRAFARASAPSSHFSFSAYRNKKPINRIAPAKTTIPPIKSTVSKMSKAFTSVCFGGERNIRHAHGSSDKHSPRLRIGGGFAVRGCCVPCLRRQRL